MKTLLTLTLLLFTGILFAQEDEVYRPAKTIEILVDANNTYKVELEEETLYQQDETTVQIYPGEVIYVELEVKKKKIESVKVVEENTHPEKTLIIDFTQKTKNNTHQAMVLRITNPFQYKLEYSAEKYGLNELWEETSVSVVPANIIAYENWSEIIVSLLLSDFKLK